jgi:hypothetical protein
VSGLEYREAFRARRTRRFSFRSSLSSASGILRQESPNFVQEFAWAKRLGEEERGSSGFGFLLGHIVRIGGDHNDRNGFGVFFLFLGNEER